MGDSLLSHPLLAGLRQTLNPENEDDEPSATEISDDCDGEQETIDLQTSESLCEDSDNDSDDDEDEDDKQTHAEFAKLADVVKNASKGVTEGTDSEYRRFLLLSCLLWVLSSDHCSTSQMAKCIQFLVSKKLIHDGDAFFSASPGENTPLLITAWIMDGCVQYIPYTMSLHSLA
jgi:hypothetical protein